MKIKILKNGPYKIEGQIPMKDLDIIGNEKGQAEGLEVEVDYGLTDGHTTLCRCGHSKNKPFCDGQHVKNAFDGTEKNDRKPYVDGAELLVGKKYNALDNFGLCCVARFCDIGIGFWDALEREDAQDVAYDEKVGNDCISGRLTLINKETGEPIEPILEKEIQLIRDFPVRRLGPIYVSGGIPIEGADGFQYEVRNRVTLCRCGESKNMPFCDASHMKCQHAKFEMNCEVPPYPGPKEKK